MTFTLFVKLTTFVKDVQAILKTDSDNLFLTQEGKAFNEGTLGRTITSFWKKTGVRPDFLMTSTRLRKIGMSTTTKNTDAEKWLVHRHMTHIIKDETNTNTPLTITSISNKLRNSSGLLHVLASNKTLKQAINHLH